MISLIGGPMIAASTAREDFYLFSTFTTKLDSRNQVEFIGLLHKFIPMSGTAPAANEPPASHLVSAGSPGRWLPEDGYSWIVNPPPPGEFRVRWIPGQLSSQHVHVIADVAEGSWKPEDGYDWVVSLPGDLRVRWEPGKASIFHPHIVAAPSEERWLPEPGYMWISNPPAPGDFRVKQVGS
jgi:hypothetical protein